MSRYPAWKRIALEQAREEIIEILDLGHKLYCPTDFHWKIDDVIDVWPSSKKFMKNGVVKEYNKLIEILK